jgi:uncharacterized membrane protein
MIDHLHIANITIHVASATFAFCIGLWVLAKPKGDRAHRRRGWVFVVAMCAVVATAAIGALGFRAAPTLTAVTVLAGYQLFSGVRAGRGRKPTGLDTGLAIVAFCLGGGFVAYLAQGGAGFWRPAVTIPIGVTLIAVAGYDLARLAAPQWRARVVALEHGVKMLAVLGALGSAGMGTLAPDWQPWSQIAPSLVVSLFAFAYVVARGKESRALVRPEASSESVRK